MLSRLCAAVPVPGREGSVVTAIGVPVPGMPGIPTSGLDGVEVDWKSPASVTPSPPVLNSWFQLTMVSILKTPPEAPARLATFGPMMPANSCSALAIKVATLFAPL